MTRAILLSLLLALASLLALAADIDGKWTGEGGRGGTQTLTLKADGAKLTGTISTQLGESAISDGKIDGNKVSFAVNIEFNGNTFSQKFSGTVAGDDLQMTIEGGRGTRNVTFKRSK
jgi:hypothetical protein